MDAGSCTAVGSVDQSVNNFRAESESTVLQPNGHVDHPDHVEHYDPHKSIVDVRLNEISTSDKFLDENIMLDSGRYAAADECSSGFTSDYSPRLQERDRCVNEAYESDNESQLSHNQLSYFPEDCEVCGAHCPDVIVGGRRSSSERAFTLEPDFSLDFVNDGDFFARTGSDRGRNPFRTSFALENSATVQSVDRNAYLSFESFCRSSALKFIRRFSRQRSSSVPPGGHELNDTAMQTEDVVAAVDEVDGPPDVDSSKNSESSKVFGDELWPEDEWPITTVSSCYVKVNDPPRSRNLAADRFVWKEGF